MNKFKSEDELRPDSSDRCILRQHKGPTVPNVPVFRQHLMIGTGILVLLLLVISIGSAIKSPQRTDSSRHGAGNNGQRNIDFSGSRGATSSSPGAQVAVNGNYGAPSLQKLRETQVTTTSEKYCVELAGNMAAALTQQRNQVNGMAAQMNGQEPVSTLPTAAAAILMPGNRSGTQLHKSALAAKAPAAAVGSAAGTIQSAPSDYYTLQLSSASRPDTLNAYARQQQLNHYWVYQTQRDDKPWYVLINGVYPSLSQAKNAVTQLPADVQAKKPWARQIGQVKKDQNN